MTFKPVLLIIALLQVVISFSSYSINYDSFYCSRDIEDQPWNDSIFIDTLKVLELKSAEDIDKYINWCISKESKNFKSRAEKRYKDFQSKKAAVQKRIDAYNFKLLNDEKFESIFEGFNKSLHGYNLSIKNDLYDASQPSEAYLTTNCNELKCISFHNDKPLTPEVKSALQQSALRLQNAALAYAQIAKNTGIELENGNGRFYPTNFKLAQVGLVDRLNGLFENEYLHVFIKRREATLQRYTSNIEKILSVGSSEEQFVKGEHHYKEYIEVKSSFIEKLNSDEEYLVLSGIVKGQFADRSYLDQYDSTFERLVEESTKLRKERLARLKRNTDAFYDKVNSSNLASVLESKGFPDQPFAFYATYDEISGIDSMYAFLSCFVLTSENKKFAIKSKATSFEVTVGDYRNNIFEPRLKLGIRMDGDLYFLESMGDPNQRGSLQRNSQTNHQFSYASVMRSMTCSRDLEIELNKFERTIQR